MIEGREAKKRHSLGGDDEIVLGLIWPEWNERATRGFTPEGDCCTSREKKNKRTVVVLLMSASVRL